MRTLNRGILCTVIASAALAATSSAPGQDTNRVTTTATTRSAPPPPAGSYTNAAPFYQYPGRGTLGLGVILGEPTGFSAKYWLSQRDAFDLGVGWSFDNETSFHLHADYLFHKYNLFPINQGRLPLYFGVGGRIRVPDHGDTRAGVRLPVGVSYLLPDIPIEVFAEVAPIIDFTPATQLRWNGGVGVRYYFK